MMEELFAPKSPALATISSLLLIITHCKTRVQALAKNAQEIQQLGDVGLNTSESVNVRSFSLISQWLFLENIVQNVFKP